MGCRARRTQWYAALALASYAAFSTATSFALHGPSTHPSREFYPFFTWSLYSNSSDRRVQYNAYVTYVNGEELPGRVHWQKIDQFAGFGDSVSLGLKALQNLGRQLRADEPGVEAIRAVFEQRYFGPNDVNYVIVRQVYDPIALWRQERGPDQEDLIGAFVYRGRS